MALQAFTQLKTSLKSAPFQIRAKFEPLSELLPLSIRFFRPPLPAHPKALLADCLPALLLPIIRRIIGLTEYRCSYTNNVGSVYLPVVIRRRNPRCKRINRPRTFWLERINNISLPRLTVFINSSLTLTILPSLAPSQLIVSQLCLLSRVKTLLTQGYIVRKLRTMPLPASHYP